MTQPDTVELLKLATIRALERVVVWYVVVACKRIWPLWTVGPRVFLKMRGLPADRVASTAVSVYIDTEYSTKQATIKALRVEATIATVTFITC